MLARLIPDKLTPLAPHDVALAFRSALETLMGKTPSNAFLALLVAQSALETGRWKSIHCFNFGNVKASPTYDGLYCQFRCNEVIGGKVQWFDPPHPQCNFRAFESAETGAIDHIRFLSQSKRYAFAWEVAQTGMPLAFVDALKHAGYFTADEAPYARAVASLWKEYLAMLAAEPKPHLAEASNAAINDFVNAESLRIEGIGAAQAQREWDTANDTEPAPPPDEAA